jgi:hypothetical protein
VLVLRISFAIHSFLACGVQRVHVQLGDAHEETRPGKGLLVFLMITDHMAGVLAQETFDALAELLRALHIHLLHPVLTRLHTFRREERTHFTRLAIVI